MDEEENPFTLPPDDKIFNIREQERQRRAQEREKVKNLRVWEKTTSSCSVRRTRRIEDEADVALADTAPKQKGGARTESIGRDPRREKENVSEFVAKKREMFLVQMSLDVKKAEILKLDEKAKQKEEALKKSQAMLDEDVTRFDAFLQSNDQKAHKAMKDAEDMIKKKQDKMQRIKTLRSQLSAIQSEIAKYRESKEECMKYKNFLRNLTPSEWKVEQERLKVNRRKGRKQKEIRDRMAQNQEKADEEIQAAEYQLEQERANPANAKSTSKERERAEREREREMERKRKKIQEKYQRFNEKLDNEVEEFSSGEEMPLYFANSKQLLDIFTSLEESNLFLIQNSQDTEQALEELTQKYAEMKRSTGATTDKMKNNIDVLVKQINEEKAHCEQLRQTRDEKKDGAEQDDLTTLIGVKVAEVHRAATDQASEHDADTLKMLAGVEQKLEEFLSALEKFDEEGYGAEIRNLELDKERTRRAVARQQRKEEADRKIEKRLKESLQRSMEPMHKKVGKQIMFRSAPLFQARRVVQEDDGYEENLKDFDVFGIWISKEGQPNAAAPQKST